MTGGKGGKLCYCKADRVVGLKVVCCCHLLPKQMRERMEQQERTLGEAKEPVLEATTRLFVYGISETVLAQELAAVFRRFGPVVEATNTRIWFRHHGPPGRGRQGGQGGDWTTALWRWEGQGGDGQAQEIEVTAGAARVNK